MTILGAIVEPDHAVCWTDSEFFIGNDAAGHCPKLVINALAQVVFLGAGSRAIQAAAEAVVREGCGFDEIADAVPAALRKSAGRHAAAQTRHSATWLAEQEALLVGYSFRAGRMLAWRLSGAAFFEPRLASRTFLPEPPGCSPLGPYDGRQMLNFARGQLGELRRHFPAAAGGALQVAEMRPNHIATWTVPDFDAAPSQIGCRRVGERVAAEAAAGVAPPAGGGCY